MRIGDSVKRSMIMLGIVLFLSVGLTHGKFEYSEYKSTDHSEFFNDTDTVYGVNRNCQTCHTSQAGQIMDSVHYLWRSENPNVEYPGGGSHGMIDRACGLVGSSALINFDESCGRCHISDSLPFPDPATGEFTAEQIASIDCMICHAPDGMYDTNNDGVYELGELSDEKVKNNGVWHQETSTGSAQSVGGRVTNEACLRCHHHGQADYHYKRGTPYTPDTDVHAKADMFCTDCHEVDAHKMARGSMTTDIFAWEMQDVEVSCEKCHTQAPHKSKTMLNQHTDKIGCKTCHIPEVAGAQRRIWAPAMGLTEGPESQVPVWDEASQKWLPYSEYDPGLVSPSYRWHAGGSSMLAEPIANPGAFDMQPATRDTTGAKILPFRKFISGQPMDALGIAQMPDTFNINFTMAGALNQMAPMLKQAGFMRPEGMTPQEEAMMSQFPNMLLFDRAEYFATGDVSAAISIGMAKMGAFMQGMDVTGMDRAALIGMGSGMWSGVVAGLDLPDNPYAPGYLADMDPTTSTGSYITVSHAVKLEGALSCKDCHTADGRLDFAALGYSPERQIELTQPTSIHAKIESYDGPQTCVKCHEKEAKDMFGSVHYQWNGETPDVTNIDGKAGKNGTAFNTYCATVNTTRRIVCWSCHVGYGKEVTDVPEPEQLNNIDCLMCHQDKYQRKFSATIPTGDFNRDFKVDVADFVYIAEQWQNDIVSDDVDITKDGVFDFLDIAKFTSKWLNRGGKDKLTYIGIDGVERNWTLPNESSGDLTVITDVAKMDITILEAAQTVHMPTRTSCLRCHATAGGGNNVKRGNISTVSADPAYEVDAHMSSAGANLRCQDCHENSDHRVLGRGNDLRVSDRPEEMTCDNGTCHNSTPHRIAKLNDHTSRVACQTCHITTYGKAVATETHRDWMKPHWVQGVYGGQGGFKPTEYKASDLVPTYYWFDGTSYVQKLGDPAIMRPDGMYETAAPNGDVASASGKIYPFKEHTTNTAMHDATHRFIPFNVSKYFFTGKFDVAVADGLDEMGLDGDWSVVEAHASQTLNHGVDPADIALECGVCHESMGGPTRMDLQGQLGYGLKVSETSLCLDCHDNVPEAISFTKMHSVHVGQWQIDCSKCHEFTRPERNLITNCSECH